LISKDAGMTYLRVPPEKRKPMHVLQVDTSGFKHR